MQQGESEALALLDGYAGWLALDEDWFESYEPDPRARAYPAFVAWLALNGSVGAVAVAFVANLAAWGENCVSYRDRAIRCGEDLAIVGTQPQIHPQA